MPTNQFVSPITEPLFLSLTDLAHNLRSKQVIGRSLTYLRSQPWYIGTTSSRVDTSKIILALEENVIITERSFELSVQSQFSFENLTQPDLCIPQSVLGAYVNRMQLLKKIAAEEDVPINQNSLDDFWSFIIPTSFTRTANLVLAENGDIRAIWENEHDEYLDLQFAGNQEAVYVIFKPIPKENRTQRTSGIKPFAFVRDLIARLNLTQLVNSQ